MRLYVTNIHTIYFSSSSSSSSSSFFYSSSSSSSSSFSFFLSLLPVPPSLFAFCFQTLGTQPGSCILLLYELQFKGPEQEVLNRADHWFKFVPCLRCDGKPNELDVRLQTPEATKYHAVPLNIAGGNWLIQSFMWVCFLRGYMKDWVQNISVPVSFWV